MLLMLHNKILIATDLSPASLPAVDRGAVLARQLGSSVLLLYVYDPSLLSPLFLFPGGAVPLPSEEQLVAFENSVQEQLRQLQRERLTGIHHAEIHIHQSPSPADGICLMARRLGADLLVLGTHGRTGLRNALIGSVAERVVRHAPCPVLTVRALDQTKNVL
jgi:nucleotide-binding universal stress UspA family protein